MKKVLTSILILNFIPVIILGVYFIQQKRENILLKVRTTSVRHQILESRHETIILRDFLQKTNNITRDCYKCRKKVLFELSEDFEKFEILTNKPTTK